MGGGGKGRGGGGSAPPFVREASQALGERSQQLFDISRPLLERGTSQIADLIRTGGPGANVPIISNAVAAQQAAGRQAQQALADQASLANLGTPFTSRLGQQLQQQSQQVASRIPVQAAAPLQGAAISSALTGGQAAQQGFTGALQALAAGQRQPIRSAAAANVGRNLFNLAAFAGGGGFGGGGAGKGIPNQQNPFGAGISPTGGFLLGPGGTLGGGV